MKILKKQKALNLRKKIDDGIKNNEYILVPKAYGKTIIGKLRKISDDFSKFHSILNIGNINKHLTADGIRELEELFEVGKGKSPFETPKPFELLKRLVLSSTFKANSDNLILDFFAGSGTTAHAVMQLNAEDGGKRRYICVQLPEATDAQSEARKAGYKTIFEITKARIEKAAAKIRSEHPDHQVDLGMKVFKTVADFRTWDAATFDLEHTNLTLPSLNDNGLHTLLTTWRVHDGQSLIDIVQTVDLAGYSAQLCGTHLYLLHGGFDSQALKVLIERLDGDADFTPERIVLYGAHMDSAMQKELAQAVESYANKKSLPIAVLARY